MSRFKILRVDHSDPERVGRKGRFLFAVYGIIPTLFIISFNLGHYGGPGYRIRLMISIPLLAIIYFFLLKKMRTTINNLKTIGELEVTQSCLRKKLGDALTIYNFESIKEIKLIKHIPATRIRESKSRYFSYIFTIIFHNNAGESFVVSDRSVDHNQKISIADTMKTLKKIVPFEVKIEI